MRRFLIFNGLVAVAFLLLWVMLVVMEVKVGLSPIQKYVFFASLPLVFLSFFSGTWLSLRHSKPKAALLGIVWALLMSPIFIVAGAVLVTNLKFLMGGHL